MPTTEFEKKWLDKINSGLLKNFPDEFIAGLDFKILKLPDKSISKGSEIFGVYEIIDRDGNTFLQSENLNEIKYILYSSRKNLKEVKLVKDQSAIDKVVNEYEKHIDEVLKNMEKDYKANFPGSKNFISVSNRIFKLANLTRY